VSFVEWLWNEMQNNSRACQYCPNADVDSTLIKKTMSAEAPREQQTTAFSNENIENVWKCFTTGIHSTGCCTVNWIRIFIARSNPRDLCLERKTCVDVLYYPRVDRRLVVNKNTGSSQRVETWVEMIERFWIRTNIKTAQKRLLKILIGIQKRCTMGKK